MSDRHRQQARQQALEDAVLRTPGRVPPEARLAAFSRARLAPERRITAPPELLPDLLAWVDRVADAAPDMADAECQALLAAGHGEDVVFEYTLAAALGAATRRLDRGLAALAAAPSPAASPPGASRAS